MVWQQSQPSQTTSNLFQKPLSIKQSIETIKQLIVFPLLYKTIFFKKVLIPNSFRFKQRVDYTLILPVDQNAGALPRQTWIDFYTVLASALHRDPPQEPAKDGMAPLRPITLRRPSQWLNHQLLREKLKNSKEPCQVLSQCTPVLTVVKK